MQQRPSLWRGTALATAAAFSVLLTSSAGFAQSNASTNTDTARRIDRLERELRAVQRRVFPGSESGLFTPENSPNAPDGTAPAPNTSNISAVGDLSVRIDAIEAQLARLTGEVEQQGHRQRELDASVTRLRSELGARLDRLEGGGTAGGEGTGAPPIAITPAPRPTPSPTPAPRPSTSTPAATPAPTAAQTAERRARVAAIEVPSTGNAAEDAYLYGYRLWEAHLYPEAQTQLQRVVDQYPNHRRASYASNLAGRALLDNNQPALAIRTFFDNYRTRPRGERAPDSVYYMGMSLIRLNRREDACRTFDEFNTIYGATASQALKNQVAAGRTQARCS